MIRVVAAVSLLLFAQDGARLEAKRPGPGEKAVIEIRSTLELTATITDSSGKTVRESSSVRSEKYSQEGVLGATPEEHVLRIACESSKVEHSGAGAMQVEPTVLEGRSFTVIRNGGTRTLKNSDGTPVVTDADGVGSWEDFGSLLPSDEAKAGLKWNVDAAALGGFFGVGNLGNNRTTLAGTIDKIEEGVATLSFQGSISGVTHEGFDLKVEVTACTMTFDVAKGRPTSFWLDGRMTGSKTVTQAYVPPGHHRPRQEEVGKVEIASKKFEVSISYK